MWCALFSNVSREGQCWFQAYLHTTHMYMYTQNCGCVILLVVYTVITQKPFIAKVSVFTLHVYTSTCTCTTCGVFCMHLSRSTRIATISQTVIKSELLEIQLLEEHWELSQTWPSLPLVGSHCVWWEFGSLCFVCIFHHCSWQYVFLLYDPHLPDMTCACCIQ